LPGFETLEISLVHPFGVLTLGFENLSLMSGNNAQGRYLVGVQSIHRTPFGTNFEHLPHPIGPLFFLFQGHMYYIT
jgi:hypothetical protein